MGPVPGLNSWEACTQQATAQAHSLSFAIGFGLGHAPLNLPKTNMTPKEKGFVSKMSFFLFCGRFVEGVYPIHLNKMSAKYGGLSVNSQFTSRNEIVSPGLPGHVEFIFCCSPTVCFSAARAVFPADSEQKRATDADLHAVL